MDNAAFHKSPDPVSIITNAGCDLIFLHSYSPDINLIEKYWANLKKKIKNEIANFNSLAQAIDHAFQGGSFKF